MALNKVILQGRIPFDINHTAGEGDKRSFANFSISVQRNYKPEGEQYYPEDLLYCKAWGNTADFINNYFGQGSTIILEAELRRDEDYEKDGEERKGQMYVHVLNAHFQQGGKSEGNEGGHKSSGSKSSSTKSKTTKSTGSRTQSRMNPLAGKAKKNPLAR